MRSIFLADMANKHGWKRGAEIGLWYGKTFFHLLDHVPGLSLYGVDIWKPGDKFIHHADQAANRKAVYEKAAEYGSRAIILEMQSVDAAKEIKDASIDFVFIDADHSFSAVCADISAWSPKVKKGGYVMGHDWDWLSVRDAVKATLPDALPGEPENDFVWSWVK